MSFDLKKDVLDEAGTNMRVRLLLGLLEEGVHVESYIVRPREEAAADGKENINGHGS